MSAQTSGNNDGEVPVPVEQIQAADWTDMDLLTRDLAGELLDREIGIEATRLEESDDEGLPEDQRVAGKLMRDRRLRAMREVRDGIAETPDSPATSPSVES